MTDKEVNNSINPESKETVNGNITDKNQVNECKVCSNQADDNKADDCKQNDCCKVENDPDGQSTSNDNVKDIINKNNREYNKDNIFYKIINNEIKSNLVLEGKHFIAINDISPKAPVHVLIIPKGNYVDYADFLVNATDEEIIDFNKGIAKIIAQMKLLPGGYKLLSNSGMFGQQEVPHMHVHILGKSSN